MASLYEIDQQLLNLLMLDEETAVDTETGEVFSKEAIDQLQMDRKKKIEGCLLFAKSEEAMAKAIKAEIAALKARMDSHNKRYERTCNYVLDSLQGEDFETGKVKAKYTKGESVEVTCPVESLPEEFIRRKPAPAPEADKVALKKAVKDGVEIKGVTLIKTVNVKPA